MGHSPSHPDKYDAIRRAGLFFAAAVSLWVLAPSVFRSAETIFSAAVGVFVAGFAANIALASIFENGRFASFGLAWQRSSVRDFVWGFVLGLGCVAAFTVAALALGWAEFGRVDAGGAWPLPVIAGLLGLGALGEELMFRGYGFQILARSWSAPGTIAITGVLFGIAHLLTNAGISSIGAINTALWGSLLGYAWWRTRALWLPVGLHFGWNLGLVAIGVPLSGLTIKATGFALQWSAGELLSGGAYGPENGLLATVCAVAVFAILRGR